MTELEGRYGCLQTFGGGRGGRLIAALNVGRVHIQPR